MCACERASEVTADKSDPRAASEARETLHEVKMVRDVLSCNLVCYIIREEQPIYRAATAYCKMKVMTHICQLFPFSFWKMMCMYKESELGSVFVFLGWDISSMDLGSAMERAQVFDWSLQEKLRPHMSRMKPRRSIYIPEFIAENQESRADNVLTGTMAEQVMLGLLTSRFMRTEVSPPSMYSTFDCVVFSADLKSKRSSRWSRSELT